MKLIIVIPDGMCDFRYEELGNLSPAEYAYTPGMDKMVQGGQIGLMQTMHDGLPLGSLVGIMGILGYDPPVHVPRGRSIFEAYTLGVPMQPNDLVARCNIVQVSPSGILEDFTANQISNEEASAYLETIKTPPFIEIHHDNSYRNVLIYRECPIDDRNLILAEPHEHMESPVDEILPRFNGEPYASFVDLMLKSRQNGLMLWPWGAGRIHDFPPMPFRSLTVTGLSFLYGMATLLGGKAVIPEGATGYRGSSFSNKLKAALASLEEVDVCLIHCNAPDEEAHVHNVLGKAEAISEIDSQVIVPLIDYLKTYPEPYRIVVVADHYTVCATGKHLPDTVPYVIYGDGLEPNHGMNGYSEANIIAANPPSIISHHFIQAQLNSSTLLPFTWPRFKKEAPKSS